MATSGADVVLRFKSDLSNLDLSGIEDNITTAAQEAEDSVKNVGSAFDSMGKDAAKAAGEVRSELDGFTNSAKETEGRIASLNSKMGDLFGDFSSGKGAVEDQEEAHSKLQEAMQGLSSATNIFLGLGLYRAFGAGTKTIQDAIAAQTEFNKVLAEMNSLISGSVATISRFREELLRIGQEVPTAPSELGAGAYQVLSAGILDATKSTEVLEVASKTAAAGLADTQETAKAMVSIMNAYGLEASMATDVSDLLFTTVKRGIVRMEDLNTAMSNILPVAAGMNVSMEELFAAIQTMTKSGVPATKATRFLRQAIQNVVQPSQEAKAAFDDLGISWGAAAFESQGLLGTMEGITGALGDLSPETRKTIQQYLEMGMSVEEAASALGESGERIQDITRIFSSRRGLMAALNLTGKQLDNFRANLEATKDAEGAMGEAFERATDTIQAQAQIAKNNLMVAFQGAEDALRDLVDVGVEVTEWMADNRDTVEAMAKAFAALVAQITALFVIKKATDMMEAFVATLKSTLIVVKQLNADSFKAISRFSGLAAAATGAVSTFQAFNDGSDQMVKVLNGVSAAFGGVTVAAETFKAAMTVTGSPLLAGLLGLGAGGAAGFFNFKGLQKLQTMFQDSTTEAEEFRDAMEGTVQDVQQLLRSKLIDAAKSSEEAWVDSLEAILEKFNEVRAEMGGEPLQGQRFRPEGGRIRAASIQQEAVREFNQELARELARQQGGGFRDGQFFGAGSGQAQRQFQRQQLRIEGGEIVVPDAITDDFFGGIEEDIKRIIPGSKAHEEGIRDTIEAMQAEQVTREHLIDSISDGMDTFNDKVDLGSEQMDTLTEETKDFLRERGLDASKVNKGFLEAATAAGTLADSLPLERIDSSEKELEDTLFSLAQQFQERHGDLQGFGDAINVIMTGTGEFVLALKDGTQVIEDHMDAFRRRANVPTDRITAQGRLQLSQEALQREAHLPPAFREAAIRFSKVLNVSTENLKNATDAVVSVGGDMDDLSDSTAETVEQFKEFQRALQARKFLETLNELGNVDIDIGRVLEEVLGQSFEDLKQETANSLNQEAIIGLLNEILSEEKKDKGLSAQDLSEEVDKKIFGEGKFGKFADRIVKITSEFDNLSTETQNLVDAMKRVQKLASALQFINLVSNIKFGGGGGGGRGIGFAESKVIDRAADEGEFPTLPGMSGTQTVQFLKSVGAGGTGVGSVSPGSLRDKILEPVRQTTQRLRERGFGERASRINASRARFGGERPRSEIIPELVEQFEGVVSPGEGLGIDDRFVERRNLDTSTIRAALGLDPSLSSTAIHAAQEELSGEKLLSTFGRSSLNFKPVPVQPGAESFFGGAQTVFRATRGPGGSRDPGISPEAIERVRRMGDRFGAAIRKMTPSVPGETAAKIQEFMPEPIVQAFQGINVQDLVGKAFQASGLETGIGGAFANVTQGSLEEIIELFFKEPKAKENVRTVADKAGDVANAFSGFQQPLQMARDNWSAVNNDLTSIGVTLTEVDAALASISEVNILNNMLSMLQNLQTIQQNVGVQRIANIGQAIESTQERILQEGQKFVTSLATDDPARLAEVLAKQQTIEQNIDQSTNNNIVLRISVGEGADTQDAAEIGERAAQEFHEQLRQRGGGVRQ